MPSIWQPRDVSLSEQGRAPLSCSLLRVDANRLTSDYDWVFSTTLLPEDMPQYLDWLGRRHCAPFVIMDGRRGLLSLIVYLGPSWFFTVALQDGSAVSSSVANLETASQRSVASIPYLESIVIFRAIMRHGRTRMCEDLSLKRTQVCRIQEDHGSRTRGEALRLIGRPIRPWHGAHAVLALFSAVIISKQPHEGRLGMCKDPSVANLARMVCR